MSKSLYSPSWYRVAELKPRLLSIFSVNLSFASFAAAEAAKSAIAARSSPTYLVLINDHNRQIGALHNPSDGVATAWTVAQVDFIRFQRNETRDGEAGNRSKRPLGFDGQTL